jgi:hypothetical protein
MKKESVEIILLIPVILLISLLWSYLIHEPVHYVSCVLQGHFGYIKFHPSIDCSEISTFTPDGLLVLYLSPYIITLIVLIILSRTENKYAKLVAYNAFFSIQLNLSAQMVMQYLFKLNGGDGLKMLRIMREAHPNQPLEPFIAIIYGIITLSVIIFYAGYRKDFTESKNRRFLRYGFIFYSLFFVLEIVSTVIFMLPLAQRI